MYLRNWFQYVLHNNEINIWLVNNFNWHFVHVHDAKAQSYRDVVIIIARTLCSSHRHTLTLHTNTECSMLIGRLDCEYMHFTFTSTRDNVIMVISSTWRDWVCFRVLYTVYQAAWTSIQFNSIQTKTILFCIVFISDPKN